ncbi:MAG: FG-GAP-like repeat-containing protein [Candidatus Zixiibacteriota bacterium]
MNKKLFILIILVALLCPGLQFSATSVRGEAIIADYSVVAEFSTIPDSVIQQVKASYKIFYGHTSHGSQIVTGMGMLRDQDSLPEIVSTLPVQNELNVLESTNILVTFNIDMDSTTINDSTFVVNGWLTGLHLGTISYNSQTRTATLDPSVDFDVGEVVTVVLTTDIKSSAGVPFQMDTSYVYSFTVRALDGNATFSSDSIHPVGNYPRSLWASELDNDGDIDLAVTGDNPGKVWILLNNGDGTFVKDSTYLIGWHPYSICAADFDRDGDNDLAVAKEEGEYMGYVRILLNNGDGKFTLHNNYYVGSIAYSVFPGDLDGDGDIDLAIAEGFGSSNVTILLNNGDGTFGPFSSYPIPGNPNSVFASDLDNDQDLDLVTASGLSGWVSVLLNNGKGSFVLDSSYASGYGPFSVFAADLDSDGDNDLAAAGHYSEYFGFVNVFLNNGDGTFFLDSTYWTSVSTYSIFVSDLDGDSDLDLAATNQMCEDVSILLNDGDGTFTSDSTYPVGLWPNAIFAADFDKDGDLDLATANSNSDDVSILLNSFKVDPNGDGTLTVSDVVYLINYLFRGGPAPDPMEAGDANCDGKVTVSDAVYLINYLFRGGPKPIC